MRSCLTGLASDVRYGLHSLATAPAFVGLAVLCLGIGIGGTACLVPAYRAMRIDPSGLLRD